MADAVGIKATAAWRKDKGLNATSPTGVKTYPETPGATDLAATHKVPFSGESIGIGIDRQKDQALLGAGQALPAPIIKRAPGGSIDFPAHYRGLERMIMCAMGFEQGDNSPESLNSPTNTAFCHLFECDDTLQDEAFTAAEWSAAVSNDRKVRRGRLGIAKQVTDWVFSSAFINKMTVSGNPQGINFSFDLIPYNKLAGSYNSASWTLPSGTNAQALFQQCVLDFGVRAVGAGSLTALGASSWELTLENNLKGDDQSLESGIYIEQPVRNGMFDVKLKIEIPRYRSTAWEAVFDADSEMAAAIRITGPEIVSGYDHMINFFMSSLRFTKYDAPVPGANPVVLTMELEAHKPQTTDIFDTNGDYYSIGTLKDSPLVCTLHNGDNFNYLTEW